MSQKGTVSTGWCLIATGMDTSTAIMCPTLPDPLNGTVTWTSLTPGSIATYTCDEGFELTGEGNRTCQNDGTWSDDPPTCERT